MAVKEYHPTSPGRRGQSVQSFKDLTKARPEKSLVEKLLQRAGRNNRGKITVRHQGSGHKRAYRIIDFKRDKWGVPGKVAAIEYDPNRSARIALLYYKDGEKRYIIAPEGIAVGDVLMSGTGAEIRVGNALPLSEIPLGSVIHNIELHQGRGGQLIRAAGNAAQLMAREGEYVQVRLQSGEVRRIHGRCLATMGQVGNLQHENVTIGKAGRRRWMGIRPTVRGVAMNPVDHPHGGGEGKAGQGNPHPVSPWGVPTKGFKTRNNKRTDRFIVKRRK